MHRLEAHGNASSSHAYKAVVEGSLLLIAAVCHCTLRKTNKNEALSKASHSTVSCTHGKRTITPTIGME